ncbi:MAG: proline dehydrogenase family protein [Flavobacteriales bacterium]
MAHRPQIPDFEDTQRAFAHLTEQELTRALVLFQTVGTIGLVRVGKALMQLALALRIPVGWAIRPTVYSHFCGGETIAECEETVATLANNKVHTILDYSAEGKEQETDLDATQQRILEAIEATQGDDRHAFSVFKVSGVASTALLQKAAQHPEHLTDAESEAWDRVQARVDELCSRAAALGTPLFIDAEETWLQEAIDALALDQMRKHNTERAVVFNTVQLYRHDRLAYLQALTHQAAEEGWHLGVKLVRGAYMEKERERAAERGYPSPIQPNKAETDRDFDAAIQWCVAHLDQVAFCAGSHNEASNSLLAKCLNEAGIPANDPRVWSAQLLGMSDHISFNLSQSGLNVAKYVPFGPIRETIPYLIRRAEENSSVAGQTSRELELIRREVQRRKQSA